MATTTAPELEKENSNEKLDLKPSHHHVEDLSPEHREYLLQRHGTLDLEPLPSSDPADPYNWPAWKVRCFSTKM
jgi:hypothetical protein